MHDPYLYLYDPDLYLHDPDLYFNDLDSYMHNPDLYLHDVRTNLYLILPLLYCCPKNIVGEIWNVLSSFCIRHLILRPGDSFGSVKHRGHCQGRCWSPWTKRSNCFATESSEFATRMICFTCEY